MHHRYQRHRWQIFPPVLLALLIPMAKFVTGVNDTGDKFATRCQWRRWQIATGINNTVGKFLKVWRLHAALFGIYYFCNIYIEQTAVRHIVWQWLIWMTQVMQVMWRDEGEHLVHVFDMEGCIWEVKVSTDIDHSPLGLEPMPCTSVALVAQYLNVRQRKLGTIIIQTVHILQHDSADTGTLPKRNLSMANSNYFQ